MLFSTKGVKLATDLHLAQIWRLKLLQRHCALKQITCESTINGPIPCENCVNLKSQLYSVQEELISVKLIIKLLQEDTESMRVNLDECDRKCISNNKSNKIPV